MARNAEGLFRQTIKYRDFDIGFGIQPITKDVITLSTQQSIEQSVELLVLTEYYGRAYKPWLGTPVYSALFENYSSAILGVLGNKITSYLNQYEPRIRVKEVNVSSPNDLDANSLTVSITYVIVGTVGTVDQEILIRRVR